MKCTDAIRFAMMQDGVTQADMARWIDYTTPSGVANALNRKHGMRVDVFVRMANALGYEIIMRRGTDEIVIHETVTTRNIQI